MGLLGVAPPGGLAWDLPWAARPWTSVPTGVIRAYATIWTTASAAEYGKRGAGLAATIFDPVAGGLTPPVHADGSGSLAGLGRRRDAISSQPVVGGAVSNPADGADATKTPAPFAAPWLPPLPQLVASHGAFFPTDDNETSNKDPNA